MTRFNEQCEKVSSQINRSLEQVLAQHQKFEIQSRETMTQLKEHLVGEFQKQSQLQSKQEQFLRKLQATLGRFPNRGLQWGQLVTMGLILIVVIVGLSNVIN